MQQHALCAAATLVLGLSLLNSSCAAPKAVQTPIAPTAAPQTGPVEGGLGPPPIPNSRDYYPAEALKKGLTARVGVVLSVDETGQAQNIVVVESGGPEFDRAAKALLSSLHYTVPPDWLSTGGPTKLFRYGVGFQFYDKRVAPFEDHRRMVFMSESMPANWSGGAN